MKTKREATLPRRQFIVSIGAVGAAAAAAVAGKVVSQPEPAVPGTDKRRGQGYQETAHVRNYYRTTQV